jgi:hypothetical protein
MRLLSGKLTELDDDNSRFHAAELYNKLLRRGPMDSAKQASNDSWVVIFGPCQWSCRKLG